MFVLITFIKNRGWCWFPQGISKAVVGHLRRIQGEIGQHEVFDPIMKLVINFRQLTEIKSDFFFRFHKVSLYYTTESLKQTYKIKLHIA